MRIKQIMTKDPSCCLPSETAQKAAAVMRAQDTGVIPVIENEQSQKVVGLVTDRDLCMNVVAEGRDPRAVRVEECMTTVVVACGPNDSMAKAIELMKQNQIRRVPVVDEQRKLVGIVSLADVVERGEAKPTETHETLKTISAPTGPPSKPRAKSKQAA
jgi:CBS domain-containing protein